MGEWDTKSGSSKGDGDGKKTQLNITYNGPTPGPGAIECFRNGLVKLARECGFTQITVKVVTKKPGKKPPSKGKK